MLRETLSALGLAVTIGDTVHRPKLKPADLVRFEQHFGRSLVNPTGEASFGIGDLMFLAWSALKREGVTDEDFDTFVESVDDMDVESEGKGVASAGSPSLG